MPRYKRTRDEAELELDVAVEPEVPSEQQETLNTLRNMWEFASLMQYMFLFGQVVKIDDDFDIEVGRHPRNSAPGGILLMAMKLRWRLMILPF